MIALLIGMVLRSLLDKPLRLLARLLPFMVLAAMPDLLLRRYLDADLPRAATAALLIVLGAATLFLRASWRRRRAGAWARPDAGRSGLAASGVATHQWAGPPPPAI